MSICAIAALASCSKNEDIVTPTGSEAAEAKVTLKLEGDGTVTRAGDTQEPADEAGADVKDLTVFFFNATGFIVGGPQYIVKGDLDKPITTTTDAAEVVVIANLGGGSVSTKFNGVSSLEQLKKVDFSSIADASGVKTVNQSKDNLYSSGAAEITFNDNVGTATVPLHFVAAKVKTVKITWGTGQNYAANESDLTTDKGKWFAIKQVYMMTAQTNSPLIPSNTTDASWGGFVPQAYAFAGGVTWGNGPWTWPVGAGTAPVQTSDYLVTPMPAAAGNEIINVLGENASHKAWYMFENSSASGHPTGLVVEVLWRSKDQSEKPEDILTKYFTVYFGEKSGNGNLPLLKAGNTYNMSIRLNGDFTPGGNAGGGGDDPTKPSVDATVTVTVAPAQWTTTGEISKDFQ
ncbi:fimbrial protein [Bacteroides fragilis]|uniref:fimbrial protein n=1 Tax=Bacteroides fragilis TaxID=817 RepID=UPI001E376E10|nr:fimbrial protein [Bacteroides fragilis]